MPTTTSSDDEHSTTLQRRKRTRPREPRRCDQLRIAAAQSFTPDEVQVLQALLEIMSRSGDTRVVARTQAPVVASLRRKAASMTRTLERRRAQRAALTAAPAA